MATIIFDVIQATGHLNPSFKLAKKFQKQGHTVAYVSSQRCENEIRLQGFDTHDLYQLQISTLQASQEAVRKKSFAFFKYIARNSIGKIFRKYLKNLSVNLMERRFMMERIRKIVALKPDLVVVDSMIPLYRAVLYSAYGINVVILQTMMSTTQAPTVPPLHSHLVPHYSQLYLKLSQLSWRKYYFKRHIRKYWWKLIYFGSDSRTLSTNIIRKCEVSRDQLDRRRVINMGLKGLYEVNLAPKELDFPRSYQNYEVLAGHAVDIDRVEPPLDSETEDLINDQSKPLIYCSLGTISTIHNSKSVYLLRKIIKAVAHQPWQVLLSTGSGIDIKKLGDIPSNVQIHSTLPQLRILRRADLMITHGGLNSIVECILFEVPMIVCPLSNMWDQTGNAARVAYHNVGVRNNLHRKSARTLTRKIEQALQSNVLRESIAQMRKNIIAGDRHQEIADTIQRVVINNQKLAA